MDRYIPKAVNLRFRFVGASRVQSTKKQHFYGCSKRLSFQHFGRLQSIEHDRLILVKEPVESMKNPCLSFLHVIVPSNKTHQVAEQLQIKAVRLLGDKYGNFT